MKLYISSDVKKKFPDLEEVLMPVYGVKVAKNEAIFTKNDYEKVINKIGKENVLSQEELKNFRKFCEGLGIDTQKYTPSVENLLKRYLKDRYVPHINNVVDSTNKVAIETFVATGVFDLDQVKGDLDLRFSYEGEEFRPLGGGYEALPAGLVVIADEEKILNLFPYRDSIYPKITEKTKNVLILADVVNGASIKDVSDAVQKVGNLLVEKAEGKKGELFYSETKNIVSIKVKERKKEQDVKSKIQVYSGTRATGRLHLGNYLGAVKGYLELQDKYSCVFSVVDLHAITTPYEKEALSENTLNVILDYLSAGLNPKKSLIEVQSMVPQHMELAYYLGTLYPVSRLEDLPTYKEKKAQFPKYINIGLLYYPVLMAADILLYKASLVPVGVDQEPHLEVTREIARNFNREFGETFPEPHRFATRGEYVPSLSGEGKMSKTKEGSFINLTDSLEEIKNKLAKMPTDSGGPASIGILGVGGVASLLKLVQLFQGEDVYQDYRNKYLSTGIKNYKEIKEELAKAIFKELEPIQERRRSLEKDLDSVKQMLSEHSKKLRDLAQETVEEVKRKMGFMKVTQ